MVYHRSESSGSSDRRQNRREEGRESYDSYSEARWSSERPARGTRDEEGSERWNRRGRSRDSSPPAWNYHGNRSHPYGPPARYNHHSHYSEPASYDAHANYQYNTAEEEKKQNVFENDGSFLEMFKRMQESKTSSPVSPKATAPVAAPAEAAAGPSTAPVKKATPVLPLVGKRRGGRVLKTGMVKKVRVEKPEDEEPKNAWSMYMSEVRKYKEASCEEEGKTRPLVK